MGSLMENKMDCDQVFEVLTRGPFPTDTRVDTTTFGEGNAGSILATVHTASLSDGAQIRSRSGGTAKRRC